MAIANPYVDPLPSDYDPQEQPVFTPNEENAFDEKFLRRSLKQLFDPHSSIELRWEIKHWVFSVPFVSRDYAATALTSILESAVSRFRESVNSDPSKVDIQACFTVDVQSLDLVDVPFRITSEFEVIPYRYSFEAVCMRLSVDPAEMREHVRFMMDAEGITGLIENEEMAVREKCAAAACEQSDFLGFDYSNPRYFVTPVTVPGLVRHKPISKGVEPEFDDGQGELFL